MNYVETVEFFQSLPVFVPRKVKEGETLFNLDAIEELLHLLGNPQKDLHYIHVGGTNGKGSTIAFKFFWEKWPRKVRKMK